MPKNDLFLDKPIMNAAGSLGFAPDPRGPIDLTKFGAFVTNPISSSPRTPAHGTRFQVHPGGFLLHTGLPNPGLSQVIRRYRQRWAQSPIPVIVHLLAAEPSALARMVERLEGIEGVMGIEVGLPPDIDPQTAYDFAQAALGELPAILRLPLEKVDELSESMAKSEVSAISLGAPRGSLPDEKGDLFSGRMYGPGIFPFALRAVEKLAGLRLPVIGAGGLYQPKEINAMLAAGAIAVQIDVALWRVGYN